MNLRSSVIAAAAIGLASTSVSAAISSSASFGPLTIQLISLSGGPAWMTFVDSANANDNFIYAYANQYNPDVADGQESYIPVPWTPVAYSATAGIANATAAISGSGVATETVLSASGSADDITANVSTLAQYQALARVSPNEGYGASFTLSPNTLLVISGTASVAAAVNSVSNQDIGDNFAYGGTSLQVYGLGSNGNGSQVANDGISVGGFAYGAPFSYSDARNLEVSFVNLTSVDMSGSFYVEATVFGVAYANAVPEPESYVLMLVGLSAVGLLVGRRRSLQ